MTLLDSRSVLIVGMSLTDPNVRRLLAYLSEHKKSHDEAHDHFVILQQRPPMDGADLQRAAEMLEEDEYKFWHGQGVKILRLSSWDGLNYLMRRIRFTDEEWDKRHKRAAHRVGGRALSRARLRRRDAAGDGLGAAAATTATAS